MLETTVNPGGCVDLGFLLFAMWMSIAILAAGHARTRNRGAWPWFLLTLFLGPIAVFLLVVWPPKGPARV